MNNTRKVKFQHGTSGAAIAVKVTPRAKKNELTGVTEDGTVKIKVTAPPVDGQANQALVKFLAEFFDIPQSNVEIIAGQTSRDKLIAISSVDPQVVQDMILVALAK
jgi:uncharacterized protein (TIGR00251 family)